MYMCRYSHHPDSYMWLCFDRVVGQTNTHLYLQLNTTIIDRNRVQTIMYYNSFRIKAAVCSTTVVPPLFVFCVSFSRGGGGVGLRCVVVVFLDHTHLRCLTHSWV